MNIRNRLVVLALCILAPCLLAATLAVWYVFQEEQETQKQLMAETARTLALLVDNELASIEERLAALAASPTLARGDLKAFYEHAKNVAPTADTTVVLSDASGNRLLNTRAPFGNGQPNGKIAITELRLQSSPTKTLVSDLFFAPVGKRYDFAVQIPVMRGDQVRYYLALGQAAEKLRPLLAQQSFPPGWLISVLDRKGTVVTRSKDADKYVGQLANPSFRKKILAGDKHGIHYGTTLNGMDTAGFFHRAPLSDWTIIINTPLEEIRRPAIRAAFFLGGFSLLMLFIALIVARWYGKRTAQPIEQLRLAAESMGRGERFVASPSGLLEADAVGFAMTQASAEIQRSKTQLELRVAEAVAAAEKAQRTLLQSQKLEALGRLTGGIAHDFNNILQTLSTALQLIPFTPESSRIQSLAETCEKAVERATLLVGQMRSFARVQDANLETVHLEHSIGNTLPLLHNALPSNIELALQVQDGLWPVTIDTLQFELALLNIVINARDAMPGGGTVKIALQNEVLRQSMGATGPGEYVRISVVDNGSGMPPEVLARALEPFYTTKPVDKGTGLGLPQAYGFAAQAKGSLLIDSTEGAGTTVAMLLPRACAAARPTGPHSSSNQPSRVHGTLLFVEDDALVQEAVGPALANAGFDVILARNGEEALAILESNSEVEILFSDIVMPGSLDGVELARIVQKRFPEIRIVLATGYTDRQINLSGVSLLAKPYQLDAAINFLAPPENERD
ncbi:MAG: ATP-binding protein [Burkholderiaceae bacterium]